MAEKLSLTEARAFLAGELKKTLAVHTERMETIRKREQKSLDEKASKLAKAEKECKSCGKKFDSVSATPSEYCGGCNRKPKNDKGEVRKGGDLVTTPDSGMPSSMGMSEKEGCKECGGVGAHKTSCATGLKNPKVMKNAQAGYGPDGQDLSLAEKNEMCKSHGGKHPMGKCDLSDVRPGKELGKGEYAARAKAELEKGDAWMDGVRSGGSISKSEKCETPGCKNEAKGASGYCPTCLLSGPEPKVLHPSDKKKGKSVKKDEKSVATANKELGGFKSLAASPTMPQKTKPGVKPGMPAMKKELPAVKAAPAKKVPGAKLPGMPKKVDTTEGSGGDVKKGLKKGAMDVALGMQKPVPHDPMAVHNLKLPGMKQTPPPVPKVNGMHPATASSLHAVGVGMHPDTRASLAALPKPPTAPKGVVGVGGKQPVGMGGGDAHKIAPPPIPAAARKAEVPATAPAPAAPTTPGSFADRSPAIQAVRKQRSPYAGVRGMAALARGEAKPGEKVPEKKGVLAVKPSPLQRGLSMTNHNRRLA